MHFAVPEFFLPCYSLSFEVRGSFVRGVTPWAPLFPTVDSTNLTGLLHLLDDLAGRGALNERKRYHFPTRCFYFFPAMDFIKGVIAALHQYIRLQIPDQCARRHLIKYGH